MLGWIKAKLGLLFGGGKSKRSRRQSPVQTRLKPKAIPQPAQQRSYPTKLLREHLGEGPPPKLHWKASHPTTIRRFKAEVTCSRGHAIVLRDHTVEADGRVIPSIICKTSGCDFHEVVRLEGWSAGRVPAKLAAA